MEPEFPDILCLLRHEKKISQRKAAEELQISQALLSHYENGLREPGLAFVRRACDYYNVTADYLLGRSALPGGEPKLTEMTQSLGAHEEDNPVQLFGSVITVLFKLLDGLGGTALSLEACRIFEAVAYKLFRYAMKLRDDEMRFSVPEDSFPDLSDVERRLSELQFRAALNRLKAGADSAPVHEKYFEKEFPVLCGNLEKMLERIDQRISRHQEGNEDAR